MGGRRLKADPPENCHLTVKKLPKNLPLKKNIAKNCHLKKN